MRRLLLLAVVFASAVMAGKPPDYLSYVQRFADTLLGHGLDHYGTVKSPMWAGVMDARTLTVPEKDVPALAGIRPSDRAVGGANAYHDVVSWRAFLLLSALTKKPGYAQAVKDYEAWFLEHTQNPDTGLLGWGEHLYYDFYQDRVVAERKNHELLEWTPPWDLLWAVNPKAVEREIAGVRYHYFADDPTALYNRHAFWNKAVHQPPKGSQPWIKHSGLYAYGFSFLYAKTKNPEWLRWSRGVSSLYWNRRNPETNLTLGCIGDPRPTSSYAAVNMPDLAYWLLKAWQQTPEETDLRLRANTFLKAYDKYFWDAAAGSYRTAVSLEGKELSPAKATVWGVEYGNEGLLPVGRIAAYFARVENDPAYLAMARRIADIAAKTPLPDEAPLDGVAFALNLNLDLYDLTKEKAYLGGARRFADLAIARFWVANGKGGLFVRKAGDPYYEAKTGVGDVLAGLVRLYLRLHPKVKDPGIYDWSY